MQFTHNSKFKLALPYLVLLCLMVSSVFLSPYLTNWKNFIVNNFATVFSSTPNPPMYGTDQAIQVIIPDNAGGMYIGGSFANIGVYAGDNVSINVNNQSIQATFPKTDPG